MVERTFVMIKPDGVQRGLVGQVIQRFESKGYKLVALKMCMPSEDHFKKHYKDLVDRSFFPGFLQFIKSGPVVAMVWEGASIISSVRRMLGETNPLDSLPGTIRGDYCISTGRNLIHGSDSVQSAEFEIPLWFHTDEINEYTQMSCKWLYE